MSEPPNESSGLTSGDPLGEEPVRPPAPRPAAGDPLGGAPARPLPEDPLAGAAAPTTSGEPPGGLAQRPAGPEVPAPGYYSPQSPPPPGAGGASAPAPGWERSTGLRLSGWWRRVGAQLIDGLIVSVGALILLIPFAAVFSVGFLGGDDVGYASLVLGLVVWVLCVAIIALLYAPTMMSRTNGQTLGRMAVGIRVVRTDRKPISFGFAVVREVLVKSLLVGFLSSATFGIVGLLDALWPLWDEEHRALHDFVVSTRVVLA